MISGTTRLIAHIGVPTESFRSPMIYNPWFAHAGIDCIVVPMGCEAEDFDQFLPLIFKLRNIAGGLITMPHKRRVVGLLDEVSTAVSICGAANAVKRTADGRLVGDMFDGHGFLAGVERTGERVAGRSALIVGAGGVGSAISASLAGAGIARLAIHDPDIAAAEALMARLSTHYPDLETVRSAPDPRGHTIIVNASPLGMADTDPLPIDVDRLSPETIVGEVVLSRDVTPLVDGARKRGCRTVIGSDMLYEQIPAYLEFFGFEAPAPDDLREIVRNRSERIF